MEFLDNIPKVSDFKKASQQKRTINFFVDLVLYVSIIFLLSLISIFAFGIMIFRGTWGTVFIILGYAVYYWSVEMSFNGKTFGKTITKTKVVTHTGERPDFVDYFIRSICRLIPIDFISFLIPDQKAYYIERISFQYEHLNPLVEY